MISQLELTNDGTDKELSGLLGPTYLLQKDNAYEQLYYTVDSKLSMAFGMLKMMIINDLNNNLAITNGLTAALNPVIANEEISEDTIFSKAFVAAVGCLLQSIRSE